MLRTTVLGSAQQKYFLLKYIPVCWHQNPPSDPSISSLCSRNTVFSISLISSFWPRVLLRFWNKIVDSCLCLLCRRNLSRQGTVPRRGMMHSRDLLKHLKHKLGNPGNKWAMVENSPFSVDHTLGNLRQSVTEIWPQNTSRHQRRNFVLEPGSTGDFCWETVFRGA